MSHSIDIDKLVSLIQSYGSELAAGNLPGQSVVQIGSRNPDMGLELEDLGDIGAFYKMNYTGTVLLTSGSVLTGASSGAKAIVCVVDGDETSGTLTIMRDGGTPQPSISFTDTEVITDSGGGAAVVDSANGAIKERVVKLPSSGVQMEMICESVDDTIAGGTGAQLVLVEFVEEGTDKTTTEVLATNGRTAVQFTSSDGFRFRSAAAILHGSGTHPVLAGHNHGVIIFRETVSKNIQGAILTEDITGSDRKGLNTTLSSNYYVPADLVSVSSFILVNSPKGEDLLFWITFRPAGTTGFFQAAQSTVYQDTFQIDFSKYPLGLTTGLDIKVTGQAKNENTLANAIFIAVEREIT